MAFAKRGGRKLVISPEGVSPVPSTRPGIVNTAVKALARAFQWSLGACAKSAAQYLLCDHAVVNEKGTRMFAVLDLAPQS